MHQARVDTETALKDRCMDEAEGLRSQMVDNERKFEECLAEAQHLNEENARQRDELHQAKTTI